MLSCVCCQTWGKGALYVYCRRMSSRLDWQFNFKHIGLHSHDKCMNKATLVYEKQVYKSDLRLCVPVSFMALNLTEIIIHWNIAR